MLSVIEIKMRKSNKNCCDFHIVFDEIEVVPCVLEIAIFQVLALQVDYRLGTVYDAVYTIIESRHLAK
ncbi:15300_t:CDS:2 [Funneliformis mosseae]|uniref:15300_t:CDS:1 n=1 Tax=Funneliformis mosseae TaxID=27381 RepID=A0A9N9H263_FUNMO|nr:15300_t:CDS:2 [Funneliformis mosseae]